MSIFVGNLPFRAEQEDVIELFAAHGEVTNCALPLERDTGRKRGFAFVEMVDEAAEAAAIEALQGAELMGRPLRINKAEPRGSVGAPGHVDGRGRRVELDARPLAHTVRVARPRHSQAPAVAARQSERRCGVGHDGWSGNQVI